MSVTPALCQVDTSGSEQESPSIPARARAVGVHSSVASAGRKRDQLSHGNPRVMPLVSFGRCSRKRAEGGGADPQFAMGGETGADPAVIAGTREAGSPNHLRRPLQPPSPCHAAQGHRKRPPVTAAGVAQPRRPHRAHLPSPWPAARRPTTPLAILDRWGRSFGRPNLSGSQMPAKKRWGRQPRARPR